MTHRANTLSAAQAQVRRLWSMLPAKSRRWHPQPDTAPSLLLEHGWRMVGHATETQVHHFWRDSAGTLWARTTGEGGVVQGWRKLEP